MLQKSMECSGRAFWKTPSRVPSRSLSGESLVCDRAAQFQSPRLGAAESSQRRFSRLPAGAAPREAPPATASGPATSPPHPRPIRGRRGSRRVLGDRDMRLSAEAPQNPRAHARGWARVGSSPRVAPRRRSPCACKYW